MNSQTSVMSDPVGPRVFPYLVAGVGIPCSLSMGLRPDPDAGWPRGMMLGKMVRSVVMLLAYAQMIRRLGSSCPPSLWLDCAAIRSARALCLLPCHAFALVLALAYAVFAKSSSVLD